MKQKGKGIYSYIVLKLLLAFGALLLSQLMFYVCNTRVLHVDGANEWVGIVWGNIVFGMATLGAFLLPYFLMMLLPVKWRWNRGWQVVSEVLYIVPVIMILACRGANSAYFQYTYRLLSDEIFSYLGISGQMGSLVPHFAVDYWYAWVVPVVIAIIFFILNSRIRLAKRNENQKYLVNDILGCVVGLLLVWFMLRGGFGKFIQPSDAAYFCQPKNAVLVSNDAYNILRTSFTSDLEPIEEMGDEDARRLFDPEQHYSHETVADSLHQPKNIVLLIVESLGQEFMGCYNHTGFETRTPFLDSLAQFCTLYDGRSNGKKSIEGITAITTSIPNLMSVPFTNSAYRNNEFIGLPTVLKRHGYYCGFFHGSYNGVMEFDKLCDKLGFDEYLGKNEYEAEGIGDEADYDGVWGIYDEPYLQFAVRRINTFHEPFLAEIFTVTSHHPFPIPEAHKGEYKEGVHPILKCVEYTDNSLRQFFEAAKTQPWFNNTLFIILGDHSGHGLTREYNDYDGWYRIPIMIYDPQQPNGRVSNRIVQQTDLFPTLVDYLGFDDPIVGFGNSVLRNPDMGWQIYYGNGFHCMVSNNPSNPSIHDITVIEGSHEEGTPDNIRFLRAVVQQYNDRIINNRLIAK